MALLAVVVVWALRDLALLVGYAVLLAYALLPIVRALENVPGPRGRHLPSGVAAAVVMLALVGIAGWLLALMIPRIAAEGTHFVSNMPAVVARIVQDLHTYAGERGFSAWLDPTIENLRADAPALVAKLSAMLGQGAARIAGGIGNLLGVALLPLLAFYLLADSAAVRASALRFVPEDAREEITRLGGAVDRALRSYVRGQAIVCLVTGASVAAGLALALHPMAILLGSLAAVAELVPYLGFLVTVIALALAGSTVSTLQVVLGLVIYVGLNWTIGTLVSPRVMGRYLKMHPFVVTISVLAGARLLGAAGALLALPGAAVVQAVIGELAPLDPPRP